MAKLEYMENGKPRSRNFEWILFQRPDGRGKVKEFAGRLVLLESVDDDGRTLEVYQKPRLYRPVQGTRWRDIMMVMWGVLAACTLNLVFRSI